MLGPAAAMRSDGRAPNTDARAATAVPGTPAGHSSPAGVSGGHPTGDRVGQEQRHAIGHLYGHRDIGIVGDQDVRPGSRGGIGVAAPSLTLPDDEDVAAVHLRDKGEPVRLNAGRPGDLSPFTVFIGRGRVIRSGWTGDPFEVHGRSVRGRRETAQPQLTCREEVTGDVGKRARPKRAPQGAGARSKSGWVSGAVMASKSGIIAAACESWASGSTPPRFRASPACSNATAIASSTASSRRRRSPYCLRPPLSGAFTGRPLRREGGGGQGARDRAGAGRGLARHRGGPPPWPAAPAFPWRGRRALRRARWRRIAR